MRKYKLLFFGNRCFRIRVVSTNMYILFLDCPRKRGERWLGSRCFQRFLVTRKGDIGVAGPCHRPRKPCAQFTHRIFERDGFIRAYRRVCINVVVSGTCLWTGTLPKCTPKCLRTLFCLLWSFTMNFCICKYVEGTGI